MCMCEDEVNSWSIGLGCPGLHCWDYSVFCYEKQGKLCVMSFEFCRNHNAMQFAKQW